MQDMFNKNKEIDTDNVTIDGFLGNKLSIAQPLMGFRAGMDSVLLGCVPDDQTKDKMIHILDMGAGSGIIALVLKERFKMFNEKSPKTIHTVFWENNDSMIALCKHNIQKNERSKTGSSVLWTHSIDGKIDNHQKEIFDIIMMNPPFFKIHDRIDMKNDKHRARHISEESLHHWFRHAAHYLSKKGRVFALLSHDFLGYVCANLPKEMGGVEICPLWFFDQKKQKYHTDRFILCARKNNDSNITQFPGIIIQNKDGSYQSAINNALQEGCWIDHTTDKAIER